jgi:acetylornithine deacetylase/succinyl-diaminopimelate desuccinylase-like protein
MDLGSSAVAHLKALLRIPSVNPPGGEGPCVEYIARVLSEHGIEHTVVHSPAGRANVVARVRGTGRARPLLLNAHLDVVPVDRDKWSRDPFGAEEADGCIWGRGAIDMKNMAAMSLATLVSLRGSALERDVIFAGVADEEAGSEHGALFLCNERKDLVDCEYVLGEGGGHTLHVGKRQVCPIQVAEKGICWFTLTAHGEPGHGSMPHPENAVVKLARAIERLGTVKLPPHVHPVVEQFLEQLAGGAGPAVPALLNPLLANHLLGVLERLDPSRARGVGAMLRNTVSPTMLEAGQKVNVIPSKASAHLDGRVIPGQTIEQFLAEIRRVVGPDLDITVHREHEGVVFSSDTPLYTAIARSVNRHAPEATVVPYMIPGFTDAFAYARLGATCYGFAPVKLPKDLDFAKMFHGHDERIPVDGFVWGTNLLAELVADFCKAA